MQIDKQGGISIGQLKVIGISYIIAGSILYTRSLASLHSIAIPNPASSTLAL